MSVQISVCTKSLIIKLGLKWTKLTEITNMITVNGQKSLTLEIVKNIQLKIMDVLGLKLKKENLRSKLSTQPLTMSKSNSIRRMRILKSY